MPLPSFLTATKKVVKDLWALRLQSLVDKFDESLDAADSNASTEIFSSQASAVETVEEKGPSTSAARKVTDNPLLEETLGLCYLGALLLRLPVSIGDIYR
jgi:RNA polymerase I-specific transcription initiation factor RRN7